MEIAYKNDISRWINPYVTEGLVHMWDGIWNAGPGIDLRNSKIWKDLVGTQDSRNLDGMARFGDNYLENINDGSSRQLIIIDNQGTYSDNLTIECVFTSVHGRQDTFGLLFSDLPTTTQYGMNKIIVGHATLCGGYPTRCGVWSNGIPVPFVNDQTCPYDQPYTTTCTVAINRSNVSKTFFCERGIYKQKWGWASLPTLTETLGLSFGRADIPMQVYSVRYYDRTLSESEIYANYLVDKKRFGV